MMHLIQQETSGAKRKNPPPGIAAEVVSLADGGVLMRLMGVPMIGAWFDLSRIHVTGAAMQALEADEESVWEFLLRHVRGDWGSCGRIGNATVTGEELRDGALSVREPGKQNKIAVLRNEGRVVSEHETRRGLRLWVITHLGPGGYTSVLLPDDV